MRKDRIDIILYVLMFIAGLSFGIIIGMLIEGYYSLEDECFDALEEISDMSVDCCFTEHKETEHKEVGGFLMWDGFDCKDRLPDPDR